MSYSTAALLVFAILVLAGMVALVHQRDFPYRFEGLLSGAVCLVFLLACSAGVMNKPIAFIKHSWSSPIHVIVYKAVIGAVFMAWFLRLYGYILLFALMRALDPKLKVGDLRPSGAWLWVVGGYLLLHVVMAVLVYQAVPR